MNNLPVIFEKDISIGLLNVKTKQLKMIDSVDENHEVFKSIKPPFDWYYINRIMLIPEPMTGVREYKPVFINGLEIECVGDFIACFHFKVYKGEVKIALSLLLPEFVYLKKHFLITNL
ncbi:hypothetical protein [Aquibacillus rhizosphaerae]|uniref:Uncharacterized protein n=1 Tax=Aquibacillus rhizosphaerae TaxID=3051431 RepID=A0ABT7L807_9BACI|nr:hypothetical protein [Aquibacillus sp. LR5S19]MDL4842004.1 hypothetical protein [Aquibacillus sp. LR5S19]